MRPYFLLGDLATTALTGVLTGLVCVAATGVGWPMPLAMLWGMVLGMAVSTPVSIGMGIWFGAFELMLPSMLGGMLAGMAIAMREAAGGLAWQAAAALGLAWAWGALAFTYLANLALRGEVER